MAVLTHTTALAAPTVIAFPPVPADVRAIAFDVEQVPTKMLVPLARNLILLADGRSADAACATTNLHAVYAAMLALCRVLDAAAYPWDFVIREVWS